MTGFDQGQLYVNDPWPLNKGARYNRNFDIIFGQMITLGTIERPEPNPVYVAHLTRS